MIGDNMKNEILLNNGLRITKARKLIISILEKEEDPISHGAHVAGYLVVQKAPAYRRHHLWPGE